MKIPSRFPLSSSAAFCLLAVLIAPLPALAVDLPAKAPIPDAMTDKTGSSGPGMTDGDRQTLPDVAPLPTPRPDAEDEKEKEQEPAKAQEDDAKPDENSGDGESKDENDAENAHETEPATPPEDFEPLSEKGGKCRADLATMGVAFTERDPVSTGDGCLMPHPIAVTALATGVAIEPEAELNCAMAQATARFVEEVVQPAAFRHFGQGVKAIRHASAYVCRPRAGTHIISEHAFGNALDIAAFVLEDGTSIGVKAYDASDQKQIDESAFMDEIRAAACGPFTTVLGPGSNAAHATHFHLDIKKRGGGYKVCE